jgi:glutathione S-transferase
MIKVHHLNNSRSQRILWLLEELRLPYEIIRYQRDPQTMFAPESLRAVHPLGKSPVIEEDGLVLAETGAIVEYVIDRYGGGRLAPARGTPPYVQYLYWLHYAEGSAMLPLLIRLYMSRLGDAAAPLKPRIDGQIKLNFDFIDASLGDKPFFLGEDLTGADIMMSFPLEAAAARAGLEETYPRLARYLARIHARPAYQAALDKGGPYALLR